MPSKYGCTGYRSWENPVDGATNQGFLDPLARPQNSRNPWSSGCSGDVMEIPRQQLPVWFSIVACMVVTVHSAGPLLGPLPPSIRMIICRHHTSSLRYFTSVVTGWADGSDWLVALAFPVSIWLTWFPLGATEDRSFRTKVAFLSYEDHAMPRPDSSAWSLGNVQGVPPVPPKCIRLPAIFTTTIWTAAKSASWYFKALGLTRSISDLGVPLDLTWSTHRWSAELGTARKRFSRNLSQTLWPTTTTLQFNNWILKTCI